MGRAGAEDWPASVARAIMTRPELLAQRRRRAQLRNGRSSSRSLASVEPVSPSRKRKLENSEQRPAPKSRAQRSEMPEVADQRPVPASLTRGNVDAFPFWGKYAPETALPGWGGRIRTSAWRNQNPLPYRLATPHPRLPLTAVDHNARRDKPQPLLAGCPVPTTSRA
jgi:hypothetical protein